MPAAAAQLGADRGAAVPVPQLHSGRAEPAVSPLHQGDQGREQLRALLGQPVLHPGAPPGLLVRLPPARDAPGHPPGAGRTAPPPGRTGRAPAWTTPPPTTP